MIYDKYEKVDKITILQHYKKYTNYTYETIGKIMKRVSLKVECLEKGICQGRDWFIPMLR